jgi:hypothetical protein
MDNEKKALAGKPCEAAVHPSRRCSAQAITFARAARTSASRTIEPQSDAAHPRSHKLGSMTDYLTCVRRRWTKMPNTMTNKTPATMRIIVVWSMSNLLPFWREMKLLKNPGLKILVGALRSNERSALNGAIRQEPPNAALLDLGAAALHENAQNDDKKNSGNNADNESLVHLNFLFSVFVFLLTPSL